MHKIDQKRGKKTVSHYFHHVEQSDGTTKLVYLGTDLRQGRDKLAKLNIEHAKPVQDPLLDEVKSLQTELDQISEHNKPYNQIMYELRMKYFKGVHTEKIHSEGKRDMHHAKAYAIVFAALILGAVVFTLFNPQISSNVILDIRAVEFNSIFAASWIMLLAMISLGIFLDTFKLIEKW